MNHVNFLPQSFIRQRAIRQRKTRHLLIVAGTVLCMGAWYVGGRAQVMSLRHESNRLQADIAAAKGQVSEMAKLQVEQKRLTHQLKVQRELAQSLPHSQILAQVGDLMPTSMALTDLALINRRPPLRTAADKADKAGGKPIAQPTEPNDVAVELTGLSPDDLLIANLVGELTEHPAFEGVKMLYSRAVTVGSIQARTFRIEMQVPLSRLYRDSANGKQEEVAHAD